MMQRQKLVDNAEDVPTSLNLLDFRKSPSKLHCTTVRTIRGKCVLYILNCSVSFHSGFDFRHWQLYFTFLILFWIPFRSALDHAVTPAERLTALNQSLRAFSHNNSKLHDYEMSLGVDKSLCSKLGYIASKFPMIDQEVILICKCLNQVYQCSKEYRKRSFRSIGASELFPLLARIWNHLLPYMEREMFQDSETGLAMQQLIQVVRTFAKLDVAIPCLVYFDNGKLLRSIVLGIRTYFDKALGPNGQVLLNEMLGLIKDLTFRGEALERRELVNFEGGSLFHVIFMCCTRKMTTTAKATEAITAIIWNLAIQENTSDMLLLREGRPTSAVVDFLLAILTEDIAETNIQDSTTILRTKRNAISAIGNFFAAEKNHKLLCSTGNNKDSRYALHVLLKQVDCDCDSIIRRRAMRAIRCLSQTRDPETRMALKEEAIVSNLVNSISRNISQDDENDRDMQLQAFYAIGNMTDAFTETDWPLVETTILQRIETTTDAKLISGACKSLVECISRSPWKRSSSCFSEMFWMRLEAAVSASKDCHGSVSMLMLTLAEREKAKRDIAPTRKSDLVSPVVLQCLTKLLEAAGIECENSRNIALGSIIALAENEANKRCIAENEQLLSGLVSFCLSQPEHSTRQRAKELIIELVPEL